MDSSNVHPEDEMSRLFLPPINRGMRVLDRSFFRKTIPTSGAVVNDPAKVSIIKKACEPDMLKLKGVIPVKTEISPVDGTEKIMSITKEEKALMGGRLGEVEQGIKKLIPLHPRVKHNDMSTIPRSLKEFIDSKDVSLVPYELKLEYKDWDYHQIITSILPEELLDEVPSGFTLFGHIAHLNLREHYLPYKHIIAQVILDKNVSCKTVVNKTEEVGMTSEFRVFDMEILAGEPNTVVELSEQSCIFKFDFAKVYWNSRLSTEHRRITEKCDGGGGPFAIPAGKRKTFVWANDLNPESYKSMVENIQRNKVGDFVKAFNEDGRDFIRNSVKDLYKLSQSESWNRVLVSPKIKMSRSNPIPPEQVPLPTVYYIPPTFSHFVMNLPATAVEFLDAFIGVYNGMEELFEPHTSTRLPQIHLHIFDKPKLEDASPSICQRISQYLNYPIKSEDIEITDVRLVAPKKRMYCATFRLPPEVAFAKVEGKRVGGNWKASLDARAWLS
ncbi:Met-10+ like-protein-domain-containing protein [Kalaharituber pfeilii]|nr:Met-10+ like-protein-domain-containing protein [Kalaharituber pfeilii]